ncbi:DUF6134 family protein [Algihabitans albus]|uniref:DUF6134 family protein n=1 Tax=Algihabitans albus TaxID=2164067 RepID=UPI0013C33C29|nr:DUF6134 family protein [Algihabitans albus]
MSAAAAGLALPSFAKVSTAGASPVFPADYRLRFAAEAAGRPAGEHCITVERDARTARLLVRNESRLLLPQRLPSGALTEPLAFEHLAEETWAEGWLQGLVSDSRIGRQRHHVRAWRQDQVLRGTRDGRSFSISGYLMTTSGWHRDTPKAEGLVDAVDGRLKRVHGLKQRSEPVPTGWGPVETTRWTLIGEIERDFWYDGTGRLIRFALPAPSGIAVTATAAEQR